MDDDEDDEIARAIELSKQTAEREEQARTNDVIKPKAKPAAANDVDDEFDFGAGLDKVAATKDPEDDFDFGSLGGGGPKEEKKQDKAPEQPAASTDLMDLLSFDAPASSN